MATQKIGFIKVRNDVTLRASPAREACFKVVTDQTEMAKFPEGSLDFRRENLHGDMNEEVQSLEIAAQSLVDFPESSWEIKFELARQCWDETRHARLFLRRLRELGGHKGQYPIINQEWGVICMLDSLAGRLAVQNRIFEAGSLDVFKEGAEIWAQWGDSDTAAILDGVVADEVSHIRFANKWLKGLKDSDPKSLLKAVAAMSSVKAWAAALSPPEHKMEHNIPVNQEDRRLAGFTD
jgi:uncharacterized ferritin-like protein (DUF455 family)